MTVTSNNIVEKLIHVTGRDIGVSAYKFLDEEFKTHTPILVNMSGSYAYGTNVATSDIDVRGIAMDTDRDIVLGKTFDQFRDVASDTTIYSFKKMMSLLTSCNPNTVEIIGLNPEHYLYVSPVGQALIDNAHKLFLSQKAYGSFIGFAEQQMYRLKQKSLIRLTADELNAHICEVVKGMESMLIEQHNMYGTHVYLDENNDILIDINIHGFPIEDLVPILTAINKTMSDYSKTKKKLEIVMIPRDKLAKHQLHYIRLLMMLYDILQNGVVKACREDKEEHALLMEIRNEKFLDENDRPTDEFMKLAAKYKSKVDDAKAKTLLPLEPNYKMIEDFMYDIITSMR